MRFIRYVQVAAASLVLALAACSAGSDDSATNSANEGTNAASASPGPIQLPNVSAGKWSGAGTLCTVFTADQAAELLGYSDGTLTATHEADDTPLTQGVDACRYTDSNAPKGLTVLISVRKGVTDQVWAKTRSEFTGASKLYKVTEYDVEGVDDAIANSSQQVVVRKGDIMVSGLNSSLGKFDQRGLVTFAAVVARVF